MMELGRRVIDGGRNRVYYILQQLYCATISPPPTSVFSLSVVSAQVLTKDAKSLQHKLSFYFSSVWNKFDAIVHSLFLISILLRFTVPDRDFVWPRMAYCLTLSMYYIRFMQAFYVQKNIGPKVIMVRRMVGVHSW